MMRIAGHCAARFRWSTPHMSIGDRREAAMTGIADYLLEHGWPDIAQPLFEAANAAIGREAQQTNPLRHLRNWGYWHEPPAPADALAERITDRIGIWQVCWSLSETEWTAVWAVAEVMKTGGGLEEAAALIGVSYSCLLMRLGNARRKARELWICPGDHIGHHYRPNKDGRKRKLDNYRSIRRSRANWTEERRELERERDRARRRPLDRLEDK